MKYQNSFVSRLLLVFVILSLGIVSQNADASNAKGQLTVAGDKVQLQHAYAKAEPGFFDETKEDIVVIVTNIPLSNKAVEDRWERSDLVRKGTLKYVEITINYKQQPISVGVKHLGFKASPSGASSNYILEVETLDEKNVEGRMYCKTEQKFFDTAYTFFRRLKNRENVFTPHRSHLYQRLVISGHSHRTVTLLYIALEVLGLFLAVLVTRKSSSTDCIVIILIFLACIWLYWFTLYKEQTATAIKA